MVGRYWGLSYAHPGANPARTTMDAARIDTKVAPYHHPCNTLPLQSAVDHAQKLLDATAHLRGPTPDLESRVRRLLEVVEFLAVELSAVERLRARIEGVHPFMWRFQLRGLQLEAAEGALDAYLPRLLYYGQKEDGLGDIFGGNNNPQGVWVRRAFR